MVYNGDPEEGAKKFERFAKLGPVMNMSETIRTRFSSFSNLLLKVRISSLYEAQHDAGTVMLCAYSHRQFLIFVSTRTNLLITVNSVFFRGALSLLLQKDCPSLLYRVFTPSG